MAKNKDRPPRYVKRKITETVVLSGLIATGFDLVEYGSGCVIFLVNIEAGEVGQPLAARVQSLNDRKSNSVIAYHITDAPSVASADMIHVLAKMNGTYHEGEIDASFSTAYTTTPTPAQDYAEEYPTDQTLTITQIAKHRRSGRTLVITDLVPILLQHRGKYLNMAVTVFDKMVWVEE